MSGPTFPRGRCWPAWAAPVSPRPRRHGCRWTPSSKNAKSRSARFAPADYAGQVHPTDAELEAYYKSNAAQFQAPEQADIEYVVLDLDAVKKSLTVNEQDLKTYYEQNAARLGGKEERRASHILIAVPKDAPPAEREKAKAKAEELLAAVQKAPDSFAEVAKKNSQDPGSAAKGGDLDFFARGAMIEAVRRRGVRPEEGRDQRRGRIRVRLSHHQADRHQGAEAAALSRR